MEVTPVPIVSVQTFVQLQFLNAQYDDPVGTVVRVALSVIFVKPTQPLNAELPIVLTPVPIVKVVNPIQPWKVLAGISVIASLIIAVDKCLQ